MKIALVHDHLAQDGGAEGVLKVFTEMFPDAPIYTLLYDQKNIDKNYKGRKIEASIIQRLPGGVSHYQWYMPFMPMAVEFFDLRAFDVVLSDTSSFAKGVITSPETLHICYCHTPTRYLWSDTHQYINELKYNKYFKKIISMVLNYVRMWDKMAADRVDKYLANSKTAQHRIEKYYRRESRVIYPPVDLNKYSVGGEQGNYFLAGCRLVPYKRIDNIIRALKLLHTGNTLTPASGHPSREGNYKLKIFGDGIDLERLKEIAGDAPNIEFLVRVSDEEQVRLYQSCLAYINPQKEDFGITVIEAMASGRPVIALRQGGAVETVIEGRTGIFIEDDSAEAIREAVKKFSTFNFNPQEIRAHAEQFGIGRFKKEINDYIRTEYEQFKLKQT